MLHFDPLVRQNVTRKNFKKGEILLVCTCHATVWELWSA